MRAIDRLGIDHLCVSGMPPVEHIALAAELGCRYISLMGGSNGSGPERHAPWSLTRDRAMRRTVVTALDDHGVSVSLGDGLGVHPDRDITRAAPLLDALAEIGVPRIATVSFDTDIDRSVDRFAQLTELAAERGMTTVLEPVPTFPVDSLTLALDVVRRVGMPELTLLIDTMHMARMGATGADLTVMPDGMIGYIQLCDAPAAPPDDYLEASVTERLPPGEGSLPLADLVAALPPDVVVGLEVPMHTEARAGVPVRIRVQRCIDGALALFESFTPKQTLEDGQPVERHL